MAVVVLAVLAVAGPAKADLILTTGTDSFRLRGHLAILHDPDGALDVAEAAASADFIPRPPEASERNYTTGAVWYRFTVTRPAGLPAEWVLAMGEPFIDDVRVHVALPGGGFREHRLGRAIPNDALPMAARLHVVALDLPEAVPTTVLVRLASRDEIQFEAALWRPGALLFAEVRQATLLGMFFTGLVFIVMFYLLFGVTLRDPPMVAYAVYVATFILFAGSHSGLMAVVFPSFAGEAASLLTQIGALGNLAALIFMWDRVLDLGRTAPRFHRLYMAAFAVMLTAMAVVPGRWYVHVIQPSFIATMAVTVVSLGLAARLVLDGRANGLVRSYIAAFVPFLAFSVAHAAEAFFPEQLDVLFVRLLGTVAILAHILILSVALARRVAKVQRDRLRADAELAATRAVIQDHRNFVSMLSHQIRNPLAIITAAVDLMELKDRLTADAAKIRTAALRIRDLTADLLADSRLEEIAAPLQARPVDLGALVRALCDERRDHARQAIDFDGRAGEVVVMGDPTLLAVLFANLLDNAVKYSLPDGRIRVRVAAAEGGAVAVVADDGPGIAAAETAKVFEKYYRSTVTAARPGTGLGLYLVRQIAERHGGTVVLHSPPGRGAEFTVRLPRAAAGLAACQLLTARGTA
ncbi:MAG: sensor histidine kinase [Pseudomonadota bacterium]